MIINDGELPVIALPQSDGTAGWQSSMQAIVEALRRREPHPQHQIMDALCGPMGRIIASVVSPQPAAVPSRSAHRGKR